MDIAGASSRSGAAARKNGVIRNAIAFELYARRHPKRSLQAGEYHSINSQFKDLSDARQRNVYEQPFTVREGEIISTSPAIWKTENL